MATANTAMEQLSVEDRQAVDGLLSDFDRNWAEGQLPARVQQLPAEPGPFRQAALTGLVKVDLKNRWQLGQAPRLETYLEQYPELGTPATVSAELVLADFQAQRQAGGGQDVAAYGERFPQQAAELRRQVEEAREQTIVAAAPAGVGDDEVVSTRPPPAPPTLPEQFGRYRVLKRLGQGGMGMVYLAHDGKLDRRVALKVPRFDTDADPDNLQRFYREARAAATISHPNLCPIFDIGEVDGQPYLTMAYIEGYPLSRLINPSRLLPPETVANVLRKVTAAVTEAHKHGIIHRDLKPSNIMVNKRGEPIVMDFGLARWVHADKEDVRLTKSGSILGAPVYMSPEQVYGDVENMGPGCDIYSLGVVMYEMLTARLPFEGNATSVLAKTLMQAPKPPSAFRPGLDPRLEAVCLKAMAKQVKDRFATMAEFNGVLADYVRSVALEKSGGSSSSSGIIAAPPSGFLAGPPASGVMQPPGSGIMPASSSGFMPGPPASGITPAPSGGVPAAPSDNTLVTDSGAVRLGLDSSSQATQVLSPVTPAPAPAAAVPTAVAAPAPPPVQASSQLGFLIRALVASLVFSLTVAATYVIYMKINPPSGVVHIDVVPPVQGIEVQIDGLSQTVTNRSEPVKLRTGTHFIEATAPNYEPYRESFMVVPDGVVVLRFTMKAKAAPPPPKVDPAKITSLAGHTGPVRGVAVSRDGKRAVSGGADKTVRVWDLEKRQALKTLEGHAQPVNGVACTADGKNVLSASGDGSVRYWDVSTGKTVKQLDGHEGEVRCVAAAPDAKQLQALSGGDDRTVRLWNLRTGAQARAFTGHTGPVRCVAFSPDGKRALSGGDDKTARLWDLSSKGKEVVRLEGHDAPVHAVAFAPDGKTAVTAGDDRTLRLWDLDGGKELRRFVGHAGKVRGVVFSADGKRIVSLGAGNGDNSLRVWDVDSGRFAYHLGLRPEEMTALAWPADNRILLTAGTDKLIRIWDPNKASADPLPTPPPAEPKAGLRPVGPPDTELARLVPR